MKLTKALTIGCWLDLSGFHARQSGGQLAEERLNVESGLGGAFDEEDAVLGGLVLALLHRHLPLFRQIRLVAYQYYNDVVLALVPNILNPFGSVQKGGAIFKLTKN